MSDYGPIMFCSASDVALFLQEAIPDERYAAADRAIAGASVAIQNYTHQVLDLVEDDEITLDCQGGTIILLPELPVVEVAEVTEDDETLIAGTDYKLGQHGKLYRVGRKWSVGIQNVTVVYTHGYADIPQDIIEVCTRAAARAYQAGLRADAMDGIPGVQAESLGDHSVSYGAEQAGGDNMLGASAARLLLLSEKDMLNRYRL